MEPEDITIKQDAEQQPECKEQQPFDLDRCKFCFSRGFILQTDPIDETFDDADPCKWCRRGRTFRIMKKHMKWSELQDYVIGMLPEK